MVALIWHGIEPVLVRVLEEVFYLFAGERHGVKEVLVDIQIEHVTHIERAVGAGRNHGIGRKRSSKGNISWLEAKLWITREVKLDSMDKIYKG